MCYSGVVLVGLLLRRRDQVPMKFMGHDLKQFKSLEGEATTYIIYIKNGVCVFVYICV